MNTIWYTDAAPSLILCVPGPWSTPPPVALAPGVDVAIEWCPRDPSLPDAFAASACPYRASIDRRAQRAVARHHMIAYARMTAGSPEAAARMLGVGVALLDAGGLAIRCVSSGIASAAARWRTLAAETEAAARALAAGDRGAAYARHQALADAYVQLPIEDDDGFDTSGLSLLGLPEVRVTRAAALRAFGAAEVERGEQVAGLLELFALYLAVEAGDRIADGQTFATARDAPRFALRHQPCTSPAPGELGFAPRGVCVLDEPG